MPTLDFKGKQHIHAHRLTIPYRPLVPDANRSLNPAAHHIIRGDNFTSSPDWVYHQVVTA